jgi:NAD(P)H-hydrate repair Nnr-like enzyme with NAD(P)H-hydrate dehydratase domain
LRDLHRFPLPSLTSDGDKDDRGQVLVVAGGRGVPGAALLTGLAALRAGAGKLQLAAPLELAVALGISAPEAAILPVPAGAQGEIAAHAAEALEDQAGAARA